MGPPARSPFKFRHAAAVRFSDLDLLGHTNHLAYLDLLENARVAYYHQVMGLQSVREIRFVLAELRVRYVASALFGQTLRVDFRITWLKRSSSGFAYEIRDQTTGQLLAEGEGAQVYMDPGQNRSLPLPEPIRERVLAFEGLDNASASITATG